jgi:aryl-alcohol dehydrogenase-like predicted oxidoreductase
MQKRELGGTGEYLSIVGFGGIVVANEHQEDANRYVAEAVEERGINYFDVAPTYGNAEERLGPALEAYRDSVFLACKTGKRDADGAEEELQQSLKRLRTDHFELYQFHGVRKMEEVNTIMGPGGALETFL